MKDINDYVPVYPPAFGRDTIIKYAKLLGYEPTKLDTLHRANKLHYHKRELITIFQEMLKNKDMRYDFERTRKLNGLIEKYTEELNGNICQ